MKDNTYEVLKEMLMGGLSETELANLLETPNTIHSLEYRKLIECELSEDDEPIGKYRITESGREFVRLRLEDNRKAYRDFWLHFISGVLVGVFGTLFTQWVAQFIG